MVLGSSVCYGDHRGPVRVENAMRTTRCAEGMGGQRVDAIGVASGCLCRHGGCSFEQLSQDHCSDATSHERLCADSHLPARRMLPPLSTRNGLQWHPRQEHGGRWAEAEYSG